MLALDLYTNALIRAILAEAVAELSQLQMTSEPSCLAHRDLLQMLRKLNEELHASNSVSTLIKFNCDRRNRSILVQRHLNERISNDLYVKLLTNVKAVAKAMKSTTEVDIRNDFVKINAVKVDVMRRWEEARQEQKKTEVDKRTRCVTMEVERLTNLVNGIQLCREKTNSFHNNKMQRLKQQINHWNRSLQEEYGKIANEIKDGELLLENAIKQAADTEDLIDKRQEIIENFHRDREAGRRRELISAEVKCSTECASKN